MARLTTKPRAQTNTLLAGRKRTPKRSRATTNTSRRMVCLSTSSECFNGQPASIVARGLEDTRTNFTALPAFAQRVPRGAVARRYVAQGANDPAPVRRKKSVLLAVLMIRPLTTHQPLTCPSSRKSAGLRRHALRNGDCVLRGAP
jgi:hypothetical protein